MEIILSSLARLARRSRGPRLTRIAGRNRITRGRNITSIPTADRPTRLTRHPRAAKNDLAA